jgi:hypothetical protein
MSESRRRVIQEIPDADTLSETASFCIQVTMPKLLCALILMVGCAPAQDAVPATPNAGPQQTAAVADSLSTARRPGERVSLVRGILKRLDPIHDQLLIHVFGGSDVRIAFDPQTELISESEDVPTRLTSLPAGSVVSVDTVIDGGKLFALSVRTGPSHEAEMNGQVVRYDAAKSQLTVRDPISPQGSVSLRITPSTIVVNRGQPASPQALFPGMLLQVWFSSTQHAANRIEILAAPGSSFSFSGRIVAVDLRSRVLALSNDSDQSIRELSIGSLDNSSLSFLREGADVSIQAEFDGDRYNVRSVALVSRNP